MWCFSVPKLTLLDIFHRELQREMEDEKQEQKLEHHHVHFGEEMGDGVKENRIVVQQRSGGRQAGWFFSSCFWFLFLPWIPIKIGPKNSLKYRRLCLNGGTFYLLHYFRTMFINKQMASLNNEQNLTIYLNCTKNWTQPKSWTCSCFSWRCFSYQS